MSIFGNLDEGKITRVIQGYTSASDYDFYGYALDMSGFGGVDFFILANDEVTAWAQQSDDNSTWNNIAGSETVVSAGTHNLGVLSISNPNDKYVRVGVNVDSGTVDGVVAVQFASDKKPQTHHSDVVATTKLFNPSEGAI